MSFYVNESFLRELKFEANSSLICFLHPHRTGGSRFKKVVSETFGRESIYSYQTQKTHYKDWSDINESDLEGVSWYAGHSNFQEKEGWRRPVFYMATVRDPVYRMFSFYNHCKSRSDHKLYALANKTSPEEFVSQGKQKMPKYFGNLMTLRVCGREDFEVASEVILSKYTALVEMQSLREFFKRLSNEAGVSFTLPENILDDEARHGDLISEEFIGLVENFAGQDVMFYNWFKEKLTSTA